MKPRPEILAGVLNGLVVLAAPFLLLALRVGDIDAFRAWRIVTWIASVAPWVIVPFALLAGWRTFVHARCYRQGRGRGWLGVLEAGATALGVLLVFLGPMLLRAPEFGAAVLGAVIYGSYALSMGLLTGMVLRLTALLALWMFDTPTAAYRPS